MKIPPQVNRYCPYCKAKTKQKVSVAKQKTRSATHPLSRGSSARAKLRGLKSGSGNKGKWGSKPPVGKWKRKTKSTKRLSLMYTCSVCKKAKGVKKAMRVSRLEIGDKVAK